MDSYTLAHRRMAPLLEAAREFDIATNPHPLALFEAGSGDLQIGCTPADNPGGLWEQIEMYAGAFSQPCAFVASVGWPWLKGRGTDRGRPLADDGRLRKRTCLLYPLALY